MMITLLEKDKGKYSELGAIDLSAVPSVAELIAYTTNGEKYLYEVQAVIYHSKDQTQVVVRRGKKWQDFIDPPPFKILSA